jgi:hypothetical protein
MVVPTFLGAFRPGSLVLNSRVWEGIGFRKAIFLDLASIWPISNIRPH